MDSAWGGIWYLIVDFWMACTWSTDWKYRKVLDHLMLFKLEAVVWKRFFYGSVASVSCAVQVLCVVTFWSYLPSLLQCFVYVVIYPAVLAGVRKDCIAIIEFWCYECVNNLFTVRLRQVFPYSSNVLGCKRSRFAYVVNMFAYVQMIVNDRTEVPHSKSRGNNGVAYSNLVNFLRDWITGGDVDSFGFVRIAAEAIRGPTGHNILCAEFNWR